MFRQAGRLGLRSRGRSDSFTLTPYLIAGHETALTKGLKWSNLLHFIRHEVAFKHLLSTALYWGRWGMSLQWCIHALLLPGNAQYSDKKSKDKTKGPDRLQMPKNYEIVDAGTLGCELRLDIRIRPVICALSSSWLGSQSLRAVLFWSPGKRVFWARHPHCPERDERPFLSSFPVWPVMCTLHSPFETFCFKNSGCWKILMPAKAYLKSSSFSGIYKYYMIVPNHGPLSSFSLCLSAYEVLWHFRSFTESENVRHGRTRRIEIVGWFHTATVLPITGLVLGEMLWLCLSSSPLYS